MRLTGDRFANLVSSVGEPERPAVGAWSVAETAAHVSAVSSLYTTMLPVSVRPHPIPGIEGRIRDAALDEVAVVNEFALAHLTERDPVGLGDQLRGTIGQLLAMSHDLDPLRPVGWLGNAQLPVASWYAHLLNELHLHGRDIARAVGARWGTPQRDAAMAFEMFLVTLLRGDTGRLLVHESMARSRIAIRFRSRYTTPVVLAIQDNRVAVDPPEGTYDVTLMFRPAALMQVLFRRLGRTRAALTGQVAAWGRKPWQVSAFLRAVRFP
ncbi:DinB family protein [Amycolatopsis rhizosphaerae]|uniref:DinB family protein n=1 Tax=Amycolatopsis rhizosphaerae TaxID=2053003 RepID=UPI001FE40C59|nr:maleylpyruvate isomerase N-terminal domain-containing protein [Amycolatopsis rhizosphaerae]